MLTERPVALPGAEKSLQHGHFANVAQAPRYAV
jgi:hypothetical protein